MVKTALTFAVPYALFALLVMPLVGVPFWRYVRARSRRRIAAFVSPGAVEESLPSINWRMRALRFSMPLLVLAFLAIAWARPLSGPKSSNAERIGVDLVVALDVSKSMWAEDVAPNRLTAIKTALTDWMRTAAGDRMGLVLFAGESIIQAPVTPDFKALERILETAGPRSISKGGTDIAKAIEMSCTLFEKSELDTRILVICTDGESLDGDAAAAARKARDQHGIKVFTIGIGSAAGAPVPQVALPDFNKLPPDRRRQRGYMRNEYGSEVISRVDDRALRAIATAGGGTYQAFTPGPGFFQSYRDSVLLPLSKGRQVLNPHDYNEWFQVPVGLAIMCMMIAPLIPVSRRRRESVGVGVRVIRPETLSQPVAAPVAVRGRKGRAAVVALLFLLTCTSPHLFGETEQQRKLDQLLEEQKFDQAIALAKTRTTEHPDEMGLRYDLGLTLYRSGRLEEAIDVFQDIAGGGSDPEYKAKALFQLGNAQFQLSRRLAGQPVAVLSMERALAYYDELLALKPSADARRNREAVKEELEAMLSAVAADRLKTADQLAAKKQPAQLSRVLQEALDAQERLVALEPDDKVRAVRRDQTKRRLAESLLDNAQRLSAETDKIENSNQKNKTAQILKQREQAVDILRRAQPLEPKDERIPKAIQEELAKASSLITRREEEKILPVLGKQNLNPTEINTLTKSREELAKALELDASNARAKELQAQTQAKLEGELLPKAEKHLADAEKKKEARGKLLSATSALETFAKAQEVSPDSQRAKEGRDKADQMVADLQAQVAAGDLAEGKKLLEMPKSEENLKAAVGHLESAAQNFAKSLETQKDNGATQDGLNEARKLLSDSRDELSRERNENGDQGEGQQSENPEENGPAKEVKLKVYSQQRRPPSTTPIAPYSSFWNKATRDW